MVGQTTETMFMVFTECPVHPPRKTKVWSVASKQGHILGLVEFKPAWRRYVFEPAQAVFDASCLRDIADFLDRVKDERNVHAENDPAADSIK